MLYIYIYIDNSPFIDELNYQRVNVDAFRGQLMAGPVGLLQNSALKR
jgi:hypothetical protein